ncbi:uncharacterized protein BX663DRAFT_475964 [Cokeromyces recurvatus]|uniref:uncharacterized protein n=1 Tax=Cokeromyces recurvatus TaxID=90255 RepID=UPI00221EF519|nr:uncharacterized protein BX663DRAFT_475964 [Cokeromyces recurvatus]KAI7900957.1 hypothetical protein BX663DRAFT_475964 [Cokeromyces recurvatus]
MGAQSSKVVRKLPTKAKQETFQNVPKESPSTLGPSIVSDIKTEFIEKDGQDPQLLENLKILGSVEIQPTVTKMRTTDTMLGIMKHRKEAEEKEEEENVSTELKGNNRIGSLSIDLLFELFEQRKRLLPGEIDRPEIRQALLREYKLDTDATLSTLLKYYNTMAIMPVLEDDKNERRLGVWVDNKVDWENKVRKIEEENEEIKKAKQKALENNDNNQVKKAKEQDKLLKDLFEEDY